jgi:FRG domain
LAERIRELEASLGQVPTLAVFVSDESDVEPLTQELNRQFANDNLQAVACVRGQIMGQDTDVRVFDIRHVKGLEFEAAFFVGIDVLARQLPIDFARYLNVGATLAATYLGITCESGLPESIALVPKLARKKVRGQSFLELESLIFKDFLRTSTAFKVFPDGDDWEPLAMAQHHGLLDWTQSDLAALWFTVRRPYEPPTASREEGTLILDSGNGVV